MVLMPRVRCLRLFAVLFLCGTPIVPAYSEAFDKHVTFSPSADIRVSVGVSNEALEYSVVKSGEVFGIVKIQMEVESEPHLSVEDFDFDGHLDFSSWNVDEGMGTFTIHRVFLFDPDTSGFVEAGPSCGDEFVNLGVDHSRRLLISTVFHGGEPMRCETRLRRKTSRRR